MLASIRQKGQNMEAEDQKLLKTSQFLEQARIEKVASQNKFLHIKGRLVTAHTKTKVVLRERKELRKQLQLKEQELCFLKQLEKQKCRFKESYHQQGIRGEAVARAAWCFRKQIERCNR